MKISTSIFGLLLFVFASLALACSGSYKESNDAAVENLRQQLIAERYGAIYRDSSEITRAQLSSDEFNNKMAALNFYLKDIDKDLNWHRDERGSPEVAIYREDNWSSMILERNGRKVNIQMSWAAQFRLCGIELIGDIPDGGMRLFRNCD